MVKSVWKSTLAVFAGLIFILITHTATDAVLTALGILPKDNLYVGTGLILVVIGYRALFSLVGCFITAKLAPRNGMNHSLILGGIGFVLSTLGAIANMYMNLGPNWYPWTLVIITMPIAWLGGKLATRK